MMWSLGSIELPPTTKARSCLVCSFTLALPILSRQVADSVLYTVRRKLATQGHEACFAAMDVQCNLLLTPRRVLPTIRWHGACTSVAPHFRPKQRSNIRVRLQGTSMTTRCPRAPSPRRLRRSRASSTTRAGTACPSSSRPARRCRSAAPRSACRRACTTPSWTAPHRLGFRARFCVVVHDACTHDECASDIPHGHPSTGLSSDLPNRVHVSLAPRVWCGVFEHACSRSMYCCAEFCCGGRLHAPVRIAAEGCAAQAPPSEVPAPSCNLASLLDTTSANTHVPLMCAVPARARQPLWAQCRWRRERARHPHPAARSHLHEDQQQAAWPRLERAADAARPELQGGPRCAAAAGCIRAPPA